MKHFLIVWFSVFAFFVLCGAFTCLAGGIAWGTTNCGWIMGSAFGFGLFFGFVLAAAVTQ